MARTTPEETVNEASAEVARAVTAQRQAMVALRRAGALEYLRATAPGIQHRIEVHKAQIAELEANLATLERTRAAFIKERASLAIDTPKLTAQEEDRIRYRRHDLDAAIAALDGDSPMGTLVDHVAVEGKPRIPATRRRIQDAREQVANAESELAEAQRQLADARG